MRTTESTTHSPRPALERHGSRIARHLAPLASLGALALGCAEPSAPVVPPEPNAIIIGGRLLNVLNVQFRAIGNPDEAPAPSVYGHLQLKVFDTGDGGFAVQWKGHLFNPQCEMLLGGGIYGIHDPEDFPTPEVRPGIDVLADQPRIDCGDNLLEGATGISAELAARLIQDPEDFIAVFFTVDGGIIAGWPYCVSDPAMPVACQRASTP